MDKIECPYCGKMMDKLNAKKWHFDNCKLKIDK
jgi:ssDNA-binding Zn-finger/Zn-ribbon topoisomerase 1